MEIKRRSLIDRGDYKIFDAEDGTEVVVYGDDSRLAHAQALARDIPALLPLGLRYGRHWFRFPGEFCIEWLTMNAHNDNGVDFVLTCTFEPSPESEVQDFNYTCFEFGFRLPDPKAGDSSPRCIRFTVRTC